MKRISEVIKNKNQMKKLQKTAIDWIKYLKEMNGASHIFDMDKMPGDYYGDQLDDMEDAEGNFEGAIQWIAWFFEIKNKKGKRWCSCCNKVETIMAIE